MNRGAAAFRKLPGTAKMWAARLGKSDATIYAYRDGRRVPPKEEREIIHADWNGPAPDEWDTLVTDGEPPRAPREPHAVEPATPEAAAGEAAKLLARIRDLQDECEAAGTDAHDLPQRIRMADTLAAAISKLGQLTGTRVTERAILASPHWLQLEEALLEALAPWPDAMRAVATKLEALRA